MIIIFEGIVDTGKSTLINYMRSTYNIPVWKRIKTQENCTDWHSYIASSRDICLNMYEILHDSGQHVNIMHDRFHVSTALKLGDDRGSIISYSNRLHAVGSVIVYTYCSDLDALRVRLKDRNKSLDIQQLHNRHEEAISAIELDSSISVIRIDTCKMGINDCCEKIVHGILKK